MTNYNERLDELMPCDCRFLAGLAWREGDPCEGCINGRLKRAITSLTKELVAGAKPLRRAVFIGTSESCVSGKEHNQAIDEFEQNLLKALEEK